MCAARPGVGVRQISPGASAFLSHPTGTIELEFEGALRHFPAVTAVDAEADVGMCVKLKELEAAIGRFASGFDASLLSASQAEPVMEQAARIEHMAATVKAAAAAR